MNAEYNIAVMEYGWLLCGPSGERSIPADALLRSMGLFPKGALVAPGIAHHYAVTRPDMGAVVAVTTPKSLPNWLALIEEAIAGYDPLFRWWAGADVGTSSAAIFAALAPDFAHALAVAEYAGSSTPRDAADFGPCKRLIDRFPEWKARLPEVAAKYPDTHWPAIIQNWDTLAGAADAEVSEFLRKL